MVRWLVPLLGGVTGGFYLITWKLFTTLFLALFVSLSPAAPQKLDTTRINETDYVSLAAWARANGAAVRAA